MEQRRLTIFEARQILGLTGPTSAADLSTAFRRVAKAVHPDSPNGDVVLFRYVVEAYHLLQNQPQPRPALGAPTRNLHVVRPAPVAVITPLQAITGGTAEVWIEERLYRLRIPAGLRHGDRLRLKNIATIPVRIRPQFGIEVFGSDLFVHKRVPAHYLRDGGRIEMDTPVGPQTAWLVPDMQEPVRLSFPGKGLPARGSHPAGDLFITLEARDEHLSDAQHMRQQFTQHWTTQASAA